MRNLITNKSAGSKTAAAKAILREDGKNYGTSFELTVRRLVDGYKAEYGNRKGASVLLSAKLGFSCDQ